MARLLQKSNQPSANTGSWGGMFSCCFTSSKDHSPSPQIPPVRVLPPTGTPAGAPSAGPSKNGSAIAKPKPSSYTDDGSGKQAMYNNWADSNEPKASESKQNVPSSTLAGKQGGAQTPAGSPPSTPMHEFAEEPYTKGYSWQAQNNQTLPESLNQPANATIHTNVKMDFKTSDLTIKIGRVDNAPNEDHAGSQAYQIRLTLLGLKKKKRWHSSILPAPNPVFNENAVFKGISIDEFQKTAIRLRLYGCKKLRRHFVFAESVVAFTALNLRGGEADIPFALASKVGHGSVVDTDSDTDDNVSRLKGSRIGSRLSMRSMVSHRPSSRSKPSSVITAASELPKLETARRVADDKEATWPELLCGLAYNVTTKRLSIHILSANRLKVSETSLKTPKVFVLLTLVTETGEKVTSSQTPDVRLAANTEFDKRFTFDMKSLNPREVTLFVRVFQKHHIHKRESLGWFAMGSKNIGEEEQSHWNEMLQAKGGVITRWHVLNENVT